MPRTKVKPRRRAGSDAKHDREGLKASRIYTKKGGGGGNFTWGVPGDESYIPDMKKGDPNYNSEDDDVVYTFSYDKIDFNPEHDFSYLLQETDKGTPPDTPLNEFKEKILIDIRELFNTGDFEEFVTRISQHNSGLHHYALVKKLLELAMEKSDHEREIVSRVFIQLQLAGILPFTQIAKAFEKIFESIEDLSLDIPNASKLLAQFLARCVADDVLPPAFLMDKYIESLSRPIIQHAKLLLSMKHGIGRLEKVWGVTLSATIDDLKIEIKNMIVEYLNSADSGEVKQLLKKLNVPFFHHEVVKRAILVALEKKEREQAMVSVLLKQLVEAEVISSKQLEMGFQRLYQEIKDITLDNPDGALIIDIFAKQAVKDGCLSMDKLNEIKITAAKLAEKESKQLEEEFSRDKENNESSE